MLKKAAALIGLLLLGYLLYQPRPSKELTIGTVNNADMILMQRLSGEFERESGIKLNWVVLGESILRQRLIDPNGDFLACNHIAGYQVIAQHFICQCVAHDKILCQFSS